MSAPYTPGDTIAAIATARGSGGIAIIRLSGAEALSVAQRAFRGVHAFAHAQMIYGHVYDADDRILDEAMAVWFQAPRSYTREDVVELQCHGGVRSAETVLARMIALGARPAEPGEFTRRAFLNGRIRLSEAEAVMALLNARSEAAQRAAIHQLTGGTFRFLKDAQETLTDLLAEIAACTDFPEEVEEAATAQAILPRIQALTATLTRRADERQSRLTRDGARVAIVGRPNVGKSSLMNALLDRERAIVTDIPGTTRDVLTDTMELDGIAVTLMDTAGQRETDDPIERMGVTRAQAAETEADVVLRVVDVSTPLTAEERRAIAAADERTILVGNKCDAGRVIEVEDAIEVSAQTGVGIPALRERLKKALKTGAVDEGIMTIPRHVQAAKMAIAGLTRASQAIEAGHPLDFAGLELQTALEALCAIEGLQAESQLIDRVFANFCVGK